MRRGLLYLATTSFFIATLMQPGAAVAQQLPTPENLAVNRDSNGKVQLLWSISKDRAVSIDQRTNSVLPVFYTLKIKSGQQSAETYDLLHEKNDSYIAGFGLIGWKRRNISQANSASWTFDGNRVLTVQPNIYKVNLLNNQLTARQVTFTFTDPRVNYDSLAPSVFLEVATGNVSQVETVFSGLARVNKRVSEGGTITGSDTFLNNTNVRNYVDNKAAPYRQETEVTSPTEDFPSAQIVLKPSNSYLESFKQTDSGSNTTQETIENFRNFTTEQNNQQILKKLLSGDQNPFNDQVVDSSDLNTAYQSFFLSVFTSSNPDTFRSKLNQIRTDYNNLFGTGGDRVLRDVFGEFLFGHTINNCDDLVQALAIKTSKLKAYGTVDYVLLGIAGAGTGLLVGGPVGAVVGAGALPAGTRFFLQDIEASQMSEEGKTKIKEFMSRAGLLRMKITYLTFGELGRGLKLYESETNNLPQGVGLNPHKLFLLEQELLLIQNRFDDCIKAAKNYIGELEQFTGDCPIKIDLIGPALCTVADLIMGVAISLADLSFRLLLQATTLQ